MYWQSVVVQPLMVRQRQVELLLWVADPLLLTAQQSAADPPWVASLQREAGQQRVAVRRWVVDRR